jgi:two-component system chemotaxis sensor kinase CheA
VEYSEKIIQSFSEETRELLGALDFNLVRLEQDPGNRGIINEIFRIAHSIKSSAALMGMDLLSDTSHKIEDLFNLVRTGKVTVDKGLVTFLLKSSEILGYILDRHIRNETGEDEIVADFRMRLSGILAIHKGVGIEKPPEPVAVRAQEDFPLSETDLEIVRIESERGNSVYHVTIRLYPEVGLKYARCFLVMNSVKDEVRIIRTQPDIEREQSEDSLFQTFHALLSTRLTEAELKAKIEDSEIREISIRRVKAEESKKQESASDRVVKLESGVRMGIEEVERIVGLLSDLVMTRNELGSLKAVVKEKLADSIVYDKLNESLFRLERVTDALQSEFLRVRMVPVEMLFKPFFRYVRETAASLNKDVDFVTYGQETLIDRSLMDRLIHPLTHLIRNALSHGIEFASERIEKGKPAKARLLLNAYQMGHNIIIEVEDDGRGLDVERIRKRALERGLVASDKKWTDQQLLDLICTPGFSTSSAVTDLSGRGVGMDVVKSTLEKLQGLLEMTTLKDQGTKFKLVIPMSLSVIKALLVRVQSDVVALPINFISESLLVRREDLAEDSDSVRYGDLPVVMLASLWTGRRDIPFPDHLKLMKVSYQDRSVGLVVDEILEEQDLIIKEIDEEFRTNPCISAGSLLGDGRIVFILNILNIIKDQT